MTPSAQDQTQAPPPSVLDLEGVRRRDPEALGAFFERYFDRIYGVVYRLLGDHHGAQDATQEVFLKIHRAAHTLDPTRDPVPWITTIAFNVCRDLWRSSGYRMARHSRPIDDPVHGAGTLPHAPGNPERDLLVQEREQLVQLAIGKLKESLRTVIVLREYQGLSYEEIAKIAGTSPMAARKRYSRALAELGKHLDKVIA